MKLNRTLLATAIALPLMQLVPASVQAAAFTFSNTSLGGANTFTADEIVISWTGSPSSLAITDTTADGFLSAGDTFTETGLIYNFGFKNAGSMVFGTGLSTIYEMFGEFLGGGGGLLTGTLSSVTPTQVIGSFAAGSLINIYYDTVIDGSLTGGSTLIGVLNPANSPSECTITAGYAKGSCKMDFDFDAGGATTPGVWTIGGIDLADLGAHAVVDINVDNISPALAAAYPGGIGSTQTVAVKHDGSMAVSVPEPSILALMGLGLAGMGMVGARRRKKS